MLFIVLNLRLLSKPFILCLPTYMDAIEEGKDKVPDPAREHAPLIKFLWERGRTLTPRLKNKVMIYDCETRSLEVLSQKEVEKSKHNPIASFYLRSQ